MEPRGVFAECVHRIYLQDEADAVISALEAENERLREALMRLFQANSTASSAATLIAALEHAKAILNREQEKQP